MTLFFPDISAFQEGIDLAGAHAVAIKATEGTTWHNTDYGRAKNNAGGHGCYVTAYHFLHAGQVGTQAAWCHGGGPGWGGVGKTPLMIDCEPTGTSRPTVGDAASFADAFRRAGGVCHLVYLPHWYWQQLGSPSLAPLADRGLALWSSAYSSYTDKAGAAGWAAYGGMTPKIWQYTDRLHFNGRDIDFNAFKGTHPGDQSGAAVDDTLAQFKALAATGKLSAPAVKPPAPTRRRANGKESLRHAVNREGTTVMRALYLMAHDPEKEADGTFGPVQRDYLLGEDYDAIMPEGMVFWVG